MDTTGPRRHAFRFVLLMGIVSLFADMTYEGARSSAGPFMAQLGASGLVVGTVAGFGELVGFALRLASGVLADKTRSYWAFTFFGYAVNVFSVPALALARTWPVAAVLVVGERFGRGARKPASDAMLANAGSQLGHGWVFGFREALDQTGATAGPLIIAATLYFGGTLRQGFAMLIVPALLALLALAIARRQFPHPRDLEAAKPVDARLNAGPFWLYTAGGAFVAAGFADFALVSYHFARAHIVAGALIPVLYAAAMLVAAIVSPLLGRLQDKVGGITLVFGFLIAAAFSPLVFLGGIVPAIIGVMLWGAGMGAQDTLFPAAIAGLIPAERRASALGTFNAVYGLAWFLGSSAMGALYDRSLPALVAVSVALQLAGLPFLVAASRSRPQSGANR